MTRCTCIYRTRTAAESARGVGPLIVLVGDPDCPAADIHARAALAALAVAAQPRT
jgi:hypothetical protein